MPTFVRVYVVIYFAYVAYLFGGNVISIPTYLF